LSAEAKSLLFRSGTEDGERFPPSILGDAPVPSPNPIKIRCPKCCGTRMVPPELVGGEFACPHCEVLIQAPGAWQGQPPPPTRRRPALPVPDQFTGEPPGIPLPFHPAIGAKWVWPVCAVAAIFILAAHLVVMFREDSAVRQAAFAG